jgi:phosphomannomutase
MRRSNTEPIVRLVVESADKEWVSHVVNTLRNV